MLRSRALRSGVRVSTPDGAAGSRLPALLALPHPQPFLRTIFARGSLWAWRFGRLQRARDTRERSIADKKRPEARESPQTVEEGPERAEPRPESQEGVQRPWWRRIFGS